MEISIRSHLDSNTVIAAKFCTWHDSCAVVACAKICCDLMATNEITARQSFHRIWIAGKKSLVKRAPGPDNEGNLLPVRRHRWMKGLKIWWTGAILQQIKIDKKVNLTQHNVVSLSHQGSHLLIWTNVNPSMDKSSVGWNYLPNPKLQWCNRWSLEMDK